MFVVPDNVPLSVHGDSWCLVQLISVCCSVLSHAGRWAQPREEEEKDDGGCEFRCLCRARGHMNHLRGGAG